MVNTLSATTSAWIKIFKLRVVVLMVLTAWAGMLLAPNTSTSTTHMLMSLIGIGLIACASGACNHLFESIRDKHMKRTQHRPLVQGTLKPFHVILGVCVSTFLGSCVLIQFANNLTYTLTLLTMFGYSIVYTLWLKPRTPQNIVIGGFFGACPPLLGWCAITQSIDAAPLILVLIVFSWTPPHFWALALAKKSDYDAANLPMYPNYYGNAMTRYHMWLYTIQLIAVSQLPFFVGLGDIIYMAGANALNLYFGYWVYQLWKKPESTDPMDVFYASIYYLFVLFTILIIEHVCTV